MAQYVILGTWTDQGIKNVKDTVSRARKAGDLLKQAGGSLDSIVWTSGGYDFVATATAPDDAALAGVLLQLGIAGMVRTHTLRAFTEAEMGEILAKLP